MTTENERRKLMNFVPPNFLPVNVLVLDTAEWLAGLREILPEAQIALLTADVTPKVKSICDEFRADLIDELPSEPKIFEIIIAEEVLTAEGDCYSKLLAYNHLLTDSGFLLTRFRNVRFIGVLEALRRGQFFNNERRLRAKADVVKLLDDAVYKEIHFLPGECADLSTAEWERFGFDNFSDDLTTKTWLVKACKCTAEVAALKEIFTPDVRADLARLLHRIEYDIDVEDNLKRLMILCDREGVFAEYLADFINQVVVHAAAKELLQARAATFGYTLDFGD